MNTFKTAVVLATLLGVGYGVHVVLNKPLNNNGNFQPNVQLPLDEFGLPNVDSQPVSQSAINEVPSANNGQIVGGSQVPNGGAFQGPEIVTPNGAADDRNQLTSVVPNTSDTQAPSQAGGWATQGTGGNVADPARGMYGQTGIAADNGINGIRQTENESVPELSLNAEDFPELPSLNEPNFNAPIASTAQQLENRPRAAMPRSQHPGLVGTAPVANHDVPTAPSDSRDGMTSPLGQHEGYAPATSSSGVSSAAFKSMWQSAQEKINAGLPADALFTLSLWYSNPELSIEQRDSLIPMLDELAGKVVYSQENHFGPPHTVQTGETLAQIAARYAITPEYIARVNGIESTTRLTPGQQLKVVTGPFRAELSRTNREITIFVGSYYAGRFSAGVGRDLPLGEMALEVAEKSGARPYHDRDSSHQTVAGDPSNPYGNYWIGLRVPGAAVNPRVGLHSTGDRVEASDTRGCISLSERDADDLQAILSIGSRFTIRR